MTRIVIPVLVILMLTVSNIGLGIGFLSMSRMLSASQAREKDLHNQIDEALKVAASFRESGSKMGIAFKTMSNNFYQMEENAKNMNRMFNECVEIRSK